MRSARTIATLAVAVALFAVVPAPAAKLGPNPANDPRLLGTPIEGFRYDRAEQCVERPARGAKALRRWLERHLRGEYWGTVRCERLSSSSMSVHSEGRAIDWHLDARIDRERRAGMRFIKDLLLAPDREGNPAALARRMGVQGLIFDCRSWWSGQSRLGDYGYCLNRQGKRRPRRKLDPTAAHVDHIHIELDRRAARLRTSFWRSPLAAE